MDLSPLQQERYARHLLLEGFDQEKLLAAGVRVRGTDPAALWAARYLAASGVGLLVVDDPAWHHELSALGPWLKFSGETTFEIAPAGDAIHGTSAAIDTVRRVLAK